MANPQILGGEGTTVEIDEMAFVRRKYNVGHLVRTQWVFGGVEVGTCKCFLVALENRSADTLLPIIQHYILPGTTVVLDLWRAYHTLGNLGYQHLTVNHAIHFVEPQTDATTNHVEALWNVAKRRNKKEIGTARTLLDSYLIEFMWRYKFKDNNNIFQLFLEHVHDVYPM